MKNRGCPPGADTITTTGNTQRDPGSSFLPGRFIRSAVGRTPMPRTVASPAPRRTLNEVLIAEVGCPRPELMAELSADGPGRNPFAPATFNDPEATQARNLH